MSVYTVLYSVVIIVCSGLLKGIKLLLGLKILMKRGENVKALTDEEREKRFAEDTWLGYFNRYLLEHSAISEKEYKKMTEKIAMRRSKFSSDRAVV